MSFLLLTCRALMSNASLSLTCLRQLLLCINCLLKLLVFFARDKVLQPSVMHTTHYLRVFSNCKPGNLNIYFMSASQMWVKKTRRTFVFNMSHVLTGVNSMVCVQLMLQTEPLGTVLALVGFLSSVLSWMGMSLCSISASFYVAPRAGLTCHSDVARGKWWRCMIVAWFLAEMWHLKCWNRQFPV